jgi:capsular exopolysaccharide synthesis family protein
MSKFSKALEQAQRDRATRLQPPPSAAPTPGAPYAPPVHPAPPPPAPSPIPLTPPPPPPPPAAASNGSPPSTGATRRRPPTRPRRSATITGEVENHLVSLVSPSGLEAEQYRALRHVVEQRHKNQALSVIAISSPGVGDGKTTTSINLAGALAQGADNSVLLIEADLRRPSIGHLLGFNGSRTVGLVDAILDPSLTLESIVQPRPPFNLSVVLAGQIPASPYEVLKSPRLGALLDEARAQYDFIVMDTPPLALVQDCRVVARWVDGVVVVVAAHQTPRSLLESALDVVDPTKLVGIVFNGFDNLGGGRHGRHYAGYYAPPESESEDVERRGALNRISKKVGSMLRRGEDAAVRNRHPRDRSR